MTRVAWMTAAGVGSWLVVAAFVDARMRTDIALGMAGPLFVADAAWLLMEQTYKRRPEALTAMMMTAFVFKLLFFAAYVALVLQVVPVRPIPFAVSFAVYFIGLHAMEALFLRRLVSAAASAPVRSSTNR
jgi:hypothetical protein